MPDKKTDENYMSIALDLAAMGRGRTSPNPMVGAVIVKDGKIVGKGWHKKAGTPHAEAAALTKSGADAEGGTLYVNLEPCCHRDKLTPPCTDAILQSRIRRVVVGMQDPNPKVSGKGVETLREAGVEVEVGVLQERCEKLNKVFTKFILTRMPFVTLKVAQTLDGKIATSTGESKWITGPEARKHGHMLRNFADAIVVGIGTVLRDDPSLTTRIEDAENTKDPERIILDSTLRIPLDAKVLNVQSKATTYIATTLAAPTAKIKELKKKNAEIIILGEGNSITMPLLMEELGKMGLINVLIEGGSRVNAEALRSGVVDKVAFFVAPKILGGDDARGSIGGSSPESLDQAIPLYDMRFTRLGEDVLVEGLLKKPDEGRPENTAQGEPLEEKTHHRRRRKRHKK
jgi:diaminohydroxyphosphoribosylaminopyrimidine deaminase / 5-amino-6-(5-phosphoribosylamino)uracil reductase